MSHASDSTTCHNCGTPLTGAFCAACGQKAQALNPSLHDFAHDATHEMLHVDGRIFQSVRRLLVSPGFLTREYFEGRRARWISPLRLYLIFSVIYFGVTAFGASSVNVGVTGTDQETAQELEKLGFRNEAELQEAVSHAMAKWTPRVMFVLVPLFAWFVHIVCRRLGKNYPLHLIFALHVHAAWFAAGAVAAAAELTRSTVVAGLFTGLAFIYAAIYFVLALRTAYPASTGRAVLRAVAIGLAYSVAAGLALAAIIVPVIF
jgi:Protein of unknown function (DUF3667)